MIRQNFTQLISTRNTTLTNSDRDANNDFLKIPGVLGDYSIALTGYIGIGNTNDTIDITLNGTRMEIATGTLVNTTIESITLNNTTSSPVNPANSYARNIATGTTASRLNYNAQTPGVLVFGYAVKKTLF